MQGLILHAAVTGDHGVILGDDGARYTFTRGGWRGNLVKAVAGMRVAFNPECRTANDVSVIQDAPQPPPAPPVSAVHSPAPGQPLPTSLPRHYQPAQAPPQQPTFSVPDPPVRTMGRTRFSPRYPQAKESKVVMALLLIFLGPLGYCIAVFMMGAKAIEVINMVVLTVLGIVTFGIVFGFWYLLCLILAVYCLAISENTWNRRMHLRHSHEHGFFQPKPEAEFCLDGVCWEASPKRTSN